MSEKQSQFHSAIKWTWVIIVAAMAINTIAPNIVQRYYFSFHGSKFFRGNTHTGRFERLEDDEWVSVTESWHAYELRKERKAREAADEKEWKRDQEKRAAARKKAEGKDPLAFLDDASNETPDFYAEIEEEIPDFYAEIERYRGRGT